MRSGPGSGFPFPFELAFPTLKYNFGGLTMGSPTGGDQGAGTINVSEGFYVNGVAVAPRIQTDLFTISSENTIPTLTHAPGGGIFLLFAEGYFISPNNYAVSGGVVSWSSSTKSLAVGDTVVCVYTY